MTDRLANDLQFFLGQYDLRLLNPEGLWLLLAVPVFFVLGLWMGEDLRWWRKVGIQLLRAGVVAALTIASEASTIAAKPRVSIIPSASVKASSTVVPLYSVRLVNSWPSWPVLRLGGCVRRGR